MDAHAVETQEKDSGQKISGRGALVIGSVLILAAFVVLWWNEGRTDASDLLRQSRPVNPETVYTPADGKLISVTGELKSDQHLGDPGLLEFGSYIFLKRTIETYAWIERAPVGPQDKTGGEEVSRAKYSYEKEWTTNPPNSDFFNEPTGHRNPPRPETSQSFTAEKARIGAYRFEPLSTDLPDGTPIAITKKNYVPSREARLQGDYIYIGKGTLRNPTIGDARASYTAIATGTRATLFGKLKGESVIPFFYGKQEPIYRLMLGSREEAIAQMPAGNEVFRWIPRLAGFLLMWAGLCLCFPPLHTTLGIFPTLGGANPRKIVVAMSVVAFGLLVLTMLVSLIAHNILLLGAAVFAFCAGTWLLGKKERDKKVTFAFERRRQTLRLNSLHLKRETDSEEEEKSESQQPPRAKQVAPSREIRFSCENCGMVYVLPASYGGRKARCKQCEHKFYIPPVSVVSKPSPTVTDTPSQNEDSKMPTD